MNEDRLSSIYHRIVENVVETIPEAWTKAYLYGEITEIVQKSYFFYYPLQHNEPVFSHDIPERFGVPEEAYDQLWFQQLAILKELWEEFRNHGDPWTNLTMYIDHTGKFNIDYDYEDVSKMSDEERMLIWMHKYLNR